MQSEDVYQTFSELLFSTILFFRSLFQAFGFISLPCEEPLLYTIGTVDAGFGIDSTELLSAIKSAEKIWEDEAGRNLFEYNDEKGLPISLVYDERQQKTQAEQDLRKRLENINVSASEQQARDQLVKFEQAKKNYENNLAQYEQAVEGYNQKVEKVNKKGGATENEQKELEDEYEDIQDQYKELESDRQRVNGLATSVNQYIENNKSLVEEYNSEITTFQDQYGGEGQEFDQGIYTGKDITIYQYDDQNRLILVLAHELGHALGIEHVEEAEAIMYYLMRDQDVQTPSLHASDLEGLANTCKARALPWKN